MTMTRLSYCISLHCAVGHYLL